MLGNPVSTESLTAFGGQAAVDENDALEAADHARQLVEDCRRMLLGSSQLPIGAWGLIDADPAYVPLTYRENTADINSNIPQYERSKRDGSGHHTNLDD